MNTETSIPTPDPLGDQMGAAVTQLIEQDCAFDVESLLEEQEEASGD